MSLRTRLQLSIVALVVTVVLALSLLHIHGVVESRFRDALELANISATQVEGFILQVVNEQTPSWQPPPTSDREVEQIWTEIVEQDAGLSTLLQKLVGSSPVIVEAIVSGKNDRVLAGSFPSKGGQKIDPLPRFEDFEGKPLWVKLQEVLASNQDYEVTRNLGILEQQSPLFTVRVILSSVLLRSQIMPQMRDLAVVSAVSLLLSILLAFLASRIASRPLARISDIIDRISRGEVLADRGSSRNPAKEVAIVESKLNLLGEQMRDVQADRTQLQANVDQLLERMEDAVLLFGHDNRLVMAGRAAARILGGRWEMMGAPIEEVFPDSTDLGALVQSAVHLRRAVADSPVTLEREGETPVHLLVSVEVLEQFPTHERVGTLVTLRDAAPRRELESQLDISNRLASISRLTGGAAHEIKNPLNSIALHLEVLKSKLDGSSAAVQGEIQVIAREITRLDRVVKSFLDFTRPVDLDFQHLDLVKLVEEVRTLVAPDAKRRNVEIVIRNEVDYAPVEGDRDLLMQGILNVVVNGIDAMPEGGPLEIAVVRGGSEWLVTVRDQGGGIPNEIRDKIYNLYFTTKGRGSGIGLAMTFRVVQLHGGTIDFTSDLGRGTEFRLRLAASKEPEGQLLPSGSNRFAEAESSRVNNRTTPATDAP